jgi:hypothetical protein
MNDHTPSRIIVAGIDGLSYKVTSRLMEAGLMPATRRVAEQGSFLRYKSIPGYSSPAIWTTLSTGFMPDVHGVSTFYDDYTALKVPFIWEVLHDAYDMSVGVLGDFAIWPPRSLKRGFIIPDMLAMDDSAYPEEYGFLRHLIDDARAGRMSPASLARHWLMVARHAGAGIATELGMDFITRKLGLGSRVPQAYRMRVLKQRINLGVFLKCCKRYQVRYGLIHNHLIDWTSHYYWDASLEGGDKSGPGDSSSLVVAAYREIDSFVAGIVREMEPNDTLVVISDHGFKLFEREKRQYVVDQESLLDLTGLASAANSFRLGDSLVLVPRDGSEKAVARIRTVMERITFKGSKVFKFIHRKEDSIIFDVDFSLGISKDDVLDFGNRQVKVEEVLAVGGAKTSGVHAAEDAVAIFCGFGIAKGREARFAVGSLFPTIMKLLDLPIPEDLPEGPARELLAEPIASMPDKRVETYRHLARDKEASVRDDAEIKRRLKALGYID